MEDPFVQHAGYDAAKLAAGAAVVVTFNYRFGFEGFGHLPGVPDNRGLLDQLVALEWVQHNIASRCATLPGLARTRFATHSSPVRAWSSGPSATNDADQVVDARWGCPVHGATTARQ